MFAKVYAGTTIGIDTQLIQIEVDHRPGLHSFSIVGLGDKAVQEAKERIISAIRNSGAVYFARRNTVNLAPAYIPKQGPTFDLGIAIAYLLSTKQLDFSVEDTIFLGELALDGTIRSVSSVYTIVQDLVQQGFRHFFVPKNEAGIAARVKGAKVYPVQTLDQAINHFSLSPISPAKPAKLESSKYTQHPDFKDIRGQQLAKRAAEIAVAGGHNMLLYGSPGSGKSMLAKAIPGILPTLQQDEIQQILKIQSVISQTQISQLEPARPFRSPHHTASEISLVGGGRFPTPGEVTRAHLGILFLDELPEFSRPSLEILRQPLEDKRVTISRATYTVQFPADFMLIGAMNPCRCGYHGDPRRECTCTQQMLRQYQSRLSGPLMDRLDIVAAMHTEAARVFEGLDRSDSSTSIKSRVEIAREIQYQRYGRVGQVNANTQDLKLLKSSLTTKSRNRLIIAGKSLKLSARGMIRVLKVARTIADLAGSSSVGDDQISESVAYRFRGFT